MLVATSPSHSFIKDAKVSPQPGAGYCGHQEARVTQTIVEIHQEAFVQQEAAEEKVYAGVFAFSVSWPREGRQSLARRRRSSLRENLAAATPMFWIHIPHRGRQRSRRSRSLHINSTGRTSEQPLRRSLESNPRPKASVRSINGVGKTNVRPIRRSLDFRLRPTASIPGDTHPRISSSSLCSKETVLSCDTIPCAIHADPMSSGRSGGPAVRP